MSKEIKPPKAKPITAEEAKEALEVENKKRVEDCSNEIQQSLKKHNCGIDVSMNLSQRGISPQIQIVSL